MMPLLCLFLLMFNVTAETGDEVCLKSIDLIGTGASQAASKVEALGHSYARYRNSQGRNVNFKYISMTSRYVIEQVMENTTIDNKAASLFAVTSVPLGVDAASRQIYRYAIEQLMKNKTIGDKSLLFAVSSVRLTPMEQKLYPGLRMFPIMAWPMVMVYNIPGVNSLVLAARTLPQIYAGNITHWDDPSIVQLNPGTPLPHQRIVPVASAGDSGDARIMTEAFSNFDEHWKSTYGTFIDPNFVGGICCNSTSWPRDIVHYFGKRTLGMVGVVASIPYTVGYLSASAISEYRMPVVSLQNSLGYRVDPTSKAIRAAVDYNKAKNPDSLAFTLSNALDPNAYPIVSFNYFIFNVTTTPGITCCQMEELAGFVEWMLGRSKAFFETQGAISVTGHVAKTVVRVILRDIRCRGENSYVRYKKSLMTLEVFPAWKLGLAVAGGVVILGIGSFLSYLVVAKRSTDRASTMRWMIDGGLVKKTGEGSSGSTMSFKSLAGVKAEYDHSTAMLCEMNVGAPMRWQASTRKEVARLLREVNHSSALQVIGITAVDGATYVITEMPGKGTLRHTLRTSKFDLHENFKMELSTNLIQGLSYLHDRGIVHGLMNSQTCYVDSSWTLKIGQWLDLAVYQRENPLALSDLLLGDVDSMTDEELLRVFFVDPRAYQAVYDRASDVFSMGLLVFEIFTFNQDSQMRSPEILQIIKNKMKKGTSELPAAQQDYPQQVEFLVRMCLGEPSSRPTIDVMENELKKLRTNNKGIVDMLMETMEAYAAKLEELVEQRSIELTQKTDMLEEVTNRIELLLHEVLPEMVATKLLAGETVEPESFECATIYFSDIVGFTEMAQKRTPGQVMDFLNHIWTFFDQTLEKYDVYKADTIGDSYMVCSGLPVPNGHNHVREISLLSLDLLKSCKEFTFGDVPGQTLQIRIGINSGPVTTGIVGTKMPQYCVFGDAVNTASRMESTSKAMHIQVSQASHDILVHHFPIFRLTYRGTVEVKGKGQMETYWMEPDLNAAALASAK